MAADLAHTPASGLWVQACGDCHLHNFGTFATPEGTPIFDINDFDETLPDRSSGPETPRHQLRAGGKNRGLSAASVVSSPHFGIGLSRSHALPVQVPPLELWRATST